MKQILWIFLLAGFTSSVQSYSIDTLPNAAAYINSFTLLPFWGAETNGSAYIAGFIQHQDAKGNETDLELVRIDVATKKVQYKIVKGFTGGKGYFWNHTIDKAGNIYLSMMYPTTKILKLNLKDSIYYKDLGNPFKNSTALIYSLSPGRDGNIYFGSSSGGTYWSEYNTTNHTITKHSLVDAANDYVLSIAGDSDYVYMQIGQRKSINLWSVNKQTEEKSLLFSIPNTTRFNLDAFLDAVYVDFGSDTLRGFYKLKSGKAEKLSTVPQTRKKVTASYPPEINKNFVSYFDPSNSQVYFSVDKKKYDHVTINNASLQTDIRRMFSFPNDKENIYYAGDYYGNYYRYNIKEKRAYLLGATGYNIYSSVALNDSIICFSGYPSGYIMLWNKNRPWTTQTTIDGKFIDARNANANPKIIHYWKGEGTPAAGFHHTYQLLKDNKGNLIGAGDVIRIGNAASIGVYNAANNKIYGIDYAPYSGLTFAGIALWNDFVIYSMKSNGKKKPKLYFYDPSRNIMVDSIDVGFTNYGKIFIQRNMLIGVSDNHIYGVYLSNKKLLWNYNLSNPINGSYLLHDGRFVVSTMSKIPAELKQFTALPVANYLEANNVLYAVRGKNIVRINFK